jgi:transcriptional regulator with XRE-family HTH domain
MPTKKVTPETALKYGHIAAALRAAMQRNGWKSLRELGEAIGIKENAGTIPSPWLNGRGAPSADYRRRLSERLGIPEEQLMARDIDSDPPPPELPRPSVNRDLSVTGRGRGFAKNQVMSLVINGDGTARVALDLNTTSQKALEIFRMLIEAGVQQEQHTGEES